jgi:hypothetical protein
MVPKKKPTNSVVQRYEDVEFLFYDQDGPCVMGTGVVIVRGTEMVLELRDGDEVLFTVKGSSANGEYIGTNIYDVDSTKVSARWTRAPFPPKYMGQECRVLWEGKWFTGTLVERVLDEHDVVWWRCDGGPTEELQFLEDEIRPSEGVTEFVGTWSEDGKDYSYFLFRLYEEDAR